MAKRLSASKLSKYYTLEEARSIPGPFVYGLHNGEKVFYVGRTIDARRRFTCYAPPKTAPLPLLRAIKFAGDALSVVILEHNPPDLIEAEKRHIASRAGELVNRMDTPTRMRASVTGKVANEMVRTQLATCPGCGGENFVNGKHKCHGRLDVLTPRANPEMQGILRQMGIIRG